MKIDRESAWESGPNPFPKPVSRREYEDLQQTLVRTLGELEDQLKLNAHLLDRVRALSKKANVDFFVGAEEGEKN